MFLVPVGDEESGQALQARCEVGNQLAEMNRQVADNLEKIITTLDNNDSNQQKAAVDAS